MIRYAIVVNARSRSEVEAYLPDNYSIVHVSKGELDKPTSDQYLISGQDVAGWTLEDYIVPRFASGLLACKEITDVHTLAELTRPGTEMWHGVPYPNGVRPTLARPY